MAVYFHLSREQAELFPGGVRHLGPDRVTVPEQLLDVVLGHTPAIRLR